MQNENRVPHYNLAKIQELIAKKKYIITHKAQDNARLDFDLTPKEIAKLILVLKNTNFYKSMTSIYDHTVWQDVYHLPFGDLILYVKFTKDVLSEFTLLSFKEK